MVKRNLNKKIREFIKDKNVKLFLISILIYLIIHGVTSFFLDYTKEESSEMLSGYRYSEFWGILYNSFHLGHLVMFILLAIFEIDLPSLMLISHLINILLIFLVIKIGVVVYKWIKR